MTEYELTRIPQYHVYKAILGEYDPSKDYVGAEGDWKSKYIPKRLKISKVDVNPSAYIHDAMYFQGGCEKCREDADWEFFLNMYEAVEISKPLWVFGTDWIRRRLGYIGAEIYYVAVDKFGKNAFNYHKDCKHLRNH